MDYRRDTNPCQHLGVDYRRDTSPVSPEVDYRRDTILCQHLGVDYRRDTSPVSISGWITDATPAPCQGVVAERVAAYTSCPGVTGPPG